jgi:hypothetical protein
LRGNTGLAAAFRTPIFFGTALSLFKERRENASERDEKADDEETEAHGAPQRGIARRTRLLGDIGVSNATRDEGEQDQAASENEEVASHADEFILRRDKHRAF